jgi:hypothetical protein
VRAVLADCPGNLRSLLISSDAVRSYFYGSYRGEDLYKRLGASETATPGELRIAWRLKQLEPCKFAVERSRVERAFNILPILNCERVTTCLAGQMMPRRFSPKLAEGQSSWKADYLIPARYFSLITFWLTNQC